VGAEYFDLDMKKVPESEVAFKAYYEWEASPRPIISACVNCMRSPSGCSIDASDQGVSRLSA